MKSIIDRDGVRWISEDVLKRYLGIDQSYLKSEARYKYRKTLPPSQRDLSVLPDTGKSWRYAKFFDKFYYDLNRIPDRAPTRYRSQLPPVEELMKKERSRDEVVEDLCQGLDRAMKNDWHDFIHYYAGDNNRPQLARGAACLHFLSREYHDCTDQRAFVMDAIKACRLMSAPYMPSSYRLLRERMDAYISGTEVNELVFLPRAGNQNALSIDDPDIFSWMVKLRAMPQNYSNAHIIREMQRLCSTFGKECPSSSWFYSQLSTEKMKFITSSRFGAKGRFANEFTPTMNIANAIFAGDCWQIDGTRVNFVEHMGPNGKRRSLFMVCLRDVYSGDILGTWFGAAENRWAYIHVLKMAVSATGKRPYELVIDRFPGHNTEEWQHVEKGIRQMGTKVTYAHKATGKAQIERWIETLQSVFMSRSKYYYGEGVNSGRRHANPAIEHMALVRKEARYEGFDFDMAWQEAMLVINAYRDTPYSKYSRKFRHLDKSPRQLHEESETPNMKKVELWQQVSLFGQQTSVKIRRDGLIKIEVMKVPYTFRVMDLEVIANHENVTLIYELDDLSVAHLFTRDEQMDLICEVREERAIQVYGPNAELGRVSELKSLFRQLQEYKESERNAIIEEGYSEFDLLTGSTLHKDDKENAETRYLMERAKDWVDHGQPRIPAEDVNLFDSDEEETISVNVLDQI